MSKEIQYITIEYFGYDQQFIRQILIDHIYFDDNDVIFLLQKFSNDLVDELGQL